MARQDANIRTFEDIKGKRVSIGTPGSGTRATMDLVMNAYGIKRSDLKSAAELKFIEMAPALCDNKIDAFVFVAGHPNAILQDAATSCRDVHRGGRRRADRRARGVATVLRQGRHPRRKCTRGPTPRSRRSAWWRRSS